MNTLPDEIAHLLQLHQDEVLNDVQAQALTTWIEADPVQRGLALAWVELEQVISQAHRDPALVAQRSRKLGERRRLGRRRDQIDRIMQRGRRARRSRTTAMWPALAIAALLLVTIGGVTWPLSTGAIRPQWQPDGSNARLLRETLTLVAEQTGTLIFSDGSRLCVHGPAQLDALVPPRHGVALTQGWIEVVAAVQPADRRLEVVTPHGVVSVIGTQFSVSVAGAQSWISVDEGRVLLVGHGGELALGAFEAATLRADGVPQRVVASEALRAAWSFEGMGEQAMDAYGSTPLSLRNGAALVAGPHGQALRLDGNTADAIAPTAPPALRGQAFTIAAWMRCDRLGARGWIAAQGDNYGLAVDRRDGSDDLFLYVHDGLAWPDLTTGDVNITDGRWHHVAGSYSANGIMQLWLDGKLVAERVAPGPIPYTLGQGLTVGSMQGERRYAGDLDEVRFYDRPLTATEVAALAAGAP